MKYLLLITSAFLIAASGSVTLTVFLAIMTHSKYYYEPNRLILHIEVLMELGFVVFGIGSVLWCMKHWDDQKEVGKNVQ